jgi:Bacterial dnaA protein helix-turn-helix
MTDIRDIMDHYKEVRDRLRRPPNAVPDPGINLPRPQRAAPPPSPLPFTPFRRTDLTLSSTLEFAALEFNISVKDIRSRRRTPAISRPRQIAIWIAARNHVQTLSGIGRYLGMHHTTVMHSRKAIDQLIGENEPMRQRILDLETRILAHFNRPTFPAISKPHLGTEKAEGVAAVGQIPPVDSGS